MTKHVNEDTVTKHVNEDTVVHRKSRFYRLNFHFDRKMTQKRVNQCYLYITKEENTVTALDAS